MTTPTREFTIGQVMTVLVGAPDHLFCSWAELLDILGHLRQDVPLVEEVRAALGECREGVAAQHPNLCAYTAPPIGASDAHVLGWLAEIEDQHGPAIELTALVDPAELAAEEVEQ